MALYLGAAYYPEHRDPDKWDYDLDMMAAAHVNCLRVGEFAWSRFEPRDGEYDFDWLDTFNVKAATHGIQLLVCPPLRTAPAWLVEQDPSVLLVREDGVRLAYGSRYTFCINHPLLREKGAALARVLAEHYAPSDNVVGYHLDNEHGDEPDCHCLICEGKFQAWCRDRYGTIAALNEVWGAVFWGLEFNSFEQIPTPMVSKTWHNPAHLLAWRRFRSASTIEAVALQADAVRSSAPGGSSAPGEQFVTTNYQPLWNPRTDYYQMGAHLDIAGTNYYPPYEGGWGGDPRAIALGLTMARSYKQQPFQLHELRNGPHMIPGAPDNSPAPGEVARLTMHAVAHGADAIFYFRWRPSPFGVEQSHGSPTDYDGRPKRVYAEVQHVFARLAALEDQIAGATVPAQAALLMDFPTRWLMETGVRWNGPATLYMDQAKRLHAALRAQGINVDAVSRDQDFAPYNLLVVPALGAMDDALAASLVTYVEQGGALVWHPFSGIKDDEARIYPDRLHPALKPLLGVDITEFATVGEALTVPFTWQQKTYAGTLFCDLPTLAGAESWGTYDPGIWFAGTPAIVRHRYGKGQVVYVTTFATSDFYRDFFTYLVQETGVPRILETDIPDAVEIVERRTAAGQRLIFLLNTSPEAQRLHLPRVCSGRVQMTDLYTQETVAGSILINGHGVRILTP